MSSEKAQQVRALTRGLRLLEILAANPNGLPLSRIAGRADLSKSSAHRLLYTLVSCGYVTQDPNSGDYLPSLKLLTLSSELIQDTNLNTVARRHLEELANTSGETVHMVLLDHGSAVYVDKYEAPNPIRMYSQIGKRAPLHCTGVGKAILAYLPEAEVARMLEPEKLIPYTSRTIVDPAALRHHLTEIRELGYAIDDGEHEEHVRCIAAPLFARDGKIAGALSIAAVSYRVELPTLLGWAPTLQTHAKALSMELAYYFDRHGG